MEIEATELRLVPGKVARDSFEHIVGDAVKKPNPASTADFVRVQN